MAEGSEKQSTVVPVYKKWWFWVIIVAVFIVGFVAISQNNQSSSNNTESAQIEGVTFKPKAVRNDNTGKWRINVISEPIDMSKHAVEYYKNYFDSDDEIHAIVNFAYDTTTKIANTPAGICVTVYEYVDGEEHDANKLFSGDMLTEKYYNSETGEELDI